MLRNAASWELEVTVQAAGLLLKVPWQSGGWVSWPVEGAFWLPVPGGAWCRPLCLGVANKLDAVSVIAVCCLGMLWSVPWS